MADAKQQPQAAVATAGVWKTIKPFVNGGASGMLATCVIRLRLRTRPPPRLPRAPSECIGGERDCNFGSPLSSDAKWLLLLHCLLEAKMTMHSALW